MSYENRKYCVIIPVYNQSSHILSLTENIYSKGLKCYIVDDGSDSATKKRLSECLERYPDIEILGMERNQGKGTAMCKGFQKAFEDNYTHCIQIDADGQHDPENIPEFIRLSEENPGAMILGNPIFDSSAPGERLYGRKITHFWTNLTTISKNIRDALCGYRCYPLKPIIELLKTEPIGRRMDFDPEIAIRLYRNGTPSLNLDTKIVYVDDDPSHFDIFKDNIRISWLFFRLFWSTPFYMGNLLRLRKRG